MRLPGIPTSVALIIGCGGDSGSFTEPMPPAAPPRGDLEIITTLSGPGMDADGYGLVVNGALLGMMEPEDTLHLVSVPAADYLIEVTGIAPHCKVGGGNPRGIRVEPGITTRVIFVSKCDPPPATPRS